MSINFGMLAVLISSLIKRYDASRIDYIFWIGVGFVFVLLLAIVLIIKKISEKTKSIKDL